MSAPPDSPSLVRPRHTVRRPVSVAHVLGAAGVGGVETFVRGVAHGIDRERFSLSVCAIGRDGALGDHLRALDVPFVCLDDPGLGPRAMVRLHAWMRAQRPDIVHTSVGGRRIRWLAKNTVGCSVLCHVHGPPDEMAEAVQRRAPGLRRRLWNAFGWGSDLILTCSDWLRSVVHEILPELEDRLHSLPNGIELPTDGDRAASKIRSREILGVPAGIPVLGFLGRMVPQKGILELSQVARDWLENTPDGRFVAVGAGPLFPLLESLQGEFGDRMVLPGERPDAAALVPAFDLMVVTSRWEAFGIVNLEAMASGVPVVAFDVDGVSEVVTHGQTGVLIPNRDVGEMSGWVRDLMRSPERRTSMGELGRRRVIERFSLQRMITTLSGFYGTLGSDVSTLGPDTVPRRTPT